MVKVSDRLRRSLSDAKSSGASEVERWCRLESEGYWDSNPAMGSDVVVPTYRTVVGQFKDVYGRVFLPPANCSFVNENRVRFGVAEIEHLLESKSVVRIHEPARCALIKEYFDIDVYSFEFSSAALVDVLSAVQGQLVDRLPAQDTVSAPRPATDVLMLRPNLWGVGLDLREAWRRCWNRSN